MQDPTQERFVIIHGHFYQPPREDPWTGYVERQPSAEPFHDWNERICAECYAANTDARTLTGQGRIAAITNNYAHISFNFGPTLLSWMQREDPGTYQRILEADAISRQQNDGHGNAIAQVYNHMIMPLANRRDRQTQVIWGLQDFAVRFGREAEGMWLAETATNQETLDALAEHGIRFIILSPTQAEAVRSDKGEWMDVSNNSIDTSQPYIVATQNGHIAVFFYDMDISKSVGFEHLLTDAASFRGRLLGALGGESHRRMVNIATDGESYGHHEPLADMCLAKLITDNEAQGHFRMTNYGWYLERFPPTLEVRLKRGNNQLGTAWSCCHGVGRWMEDCGCGREGDWHQRWRAPLRKALSFLRDEIAAASERLGAAHVRDVWQARNGYIAALNEPSAQTLERFYAEHLLRPEDPESRRILLMLMEAQRYGQLMFTSCAWFFAEISRIEAVQCLRYAARALQLMCDELPEEVEERFLGILQKAPSNVGHFGDGLRVWKELVQPYVFDDVRAVNEHVLDALFGGGGEGRGDSSYQISLSDINRIDKPDGTVVAGLAQLRQAYLPGEERFLFYVLRRSQLNIVTYVKHFEDSRVKDYLDELVSQHEIRDIVRRMGDWFPRSYGIKDLRLDTKERLAKVLFEDSFRELHELRSVKLDQHLELVEFYARLRLSIPTVERANLEATLNNEISHQLDLLEADSEHRFDFDRVARLLRAARRTGLAINRSAVADLFALKIERKLDEYLHGRDHTAVPSLLEMIAFTRSSKLSFRLRPLENRVFSFLWREVAPWVAEGSGQLSDDVRQFGANVVAIAAELNIHVTPFKTLLEAGGGRDEPWLAEEAEQGLREAG